MKIIAQQGDSVDSLCWRHYGTTRGMDEAVFEANPGLAAIGPKLPIGYVVEMPENPAQANYTNKINLWD